MSSTSQSSQIAITNGIPSTQNARNSISEHGVRRGNNAVWYEPGRDFCFYVAAQEACRASKDRLGKLKLSEDEWFALSSDWGINHVLDQMKRISDEQERQSHGSNLMKSIRRFTNGFCDLAVQTSGIVELLLPNSPEYTVTYGLLFMLFQAVVDKRKYQDSIVEFIEELKHKLPLIDFYGQVFPTNEMKICVANLYVEILSFLEEAFVYCRSGRLSKLVDAVLQPGDDRLADCTARIAAAASRLDALKEAGHIAEQSDMRELLASTNSVVVQLYQNMNSFSTAVGSGLMLLNRKCDQMENRSAIMFNVQANQYVQSLCDILLPETIEVADELELVRQHGFRLAPRDHWDTNGLLDDLVLWSRQGRKLPLWIGGSSGNQDSWVTEFTVDLVTALQQQPVTLLFAFCASQEPEFTTTTTLVKRLISQLLIAHPEMIYTKASRLTQRLFQRATSTEALWKIFEYLLCELGPTPTFIVLDRFEMCRPSNDNTSQFLPVLLKIPQQFPSVSLIVTSIHKPPDEAVSQLYSLYIDTGKPARRRDR